MMYPYYKADLDAGRITYEDALELLCLLRFKDMELNRTSGKMNRKKNAGFAKWHNFLIGGVKEDGTDATNDISYMLLEAALITRTPHHTINEKCGKRVCRHRCTRTVKGLRLRCRRKAKLHLDRICACWPYVSNYPLSARRHYYRICVDRLEASACLII